MNNQFTQHVNGANAKGTQVGEIKNYYAGETINIGLSAEEVNQILQTIQQLREEDRKEIESYFKQIKEAETEAQKKSIAAKAAGFIRDRACGIFDSLVANSIFMLANGK